ncbi:hypothetical protein B0T24DRAFT_700082, partial [Lasiosphaeria ovina]
ASSTVHPFPTQRSQRPEDNNFRFSARNTHPPDLPKRPHALSTPLTASRDLKMKIETTIPTLKGEENFEAWKMGIRMALGRDMLLQYIEGDSQKPQTATTTKEYQEWFAGCCRAALILLASLRDPAVTQILYRHGWVQSEEDPKVIYDFVCEVMLNLIKVSHRYSPVA